MTLRSALSRWMTFVALAVAAVSAWTGGAVASASVLKAGAGTTTPASFAGYWFVHGGQLFIGSYSYTDSSGHAVTNWYGIRTEANGQGIETDPLTLSLSSNRPHGRNHPGFYVHGRPDRESGAEPRPQTELRQW